MDEARLMEIEAHLQWLRDKCFFGREAEMCAELVAEVRRLRTIREPRIVQPSGN